MNILEARRRLLDGEIKKRTAEGENISVRSVSRMRPGLTLYGKSEQETTTGAQLVDFGSEADADSTQNGITITNNGDGSFTVTGTPTVTEGYVFTFYLAKNVTLSDGTYRTNVSVRILRKDGTNIYVSAIFTFNSETDEAIDFYYQRNVQNYVDGETIWPMLNSGSTALPWEPYTGGQPSPSPDYPQEIKSVGDSGTVNVTLSNGGSQSQTLPVQTPNGLPGIPVDSGGNYTDADGQQWVCNYRDYARGVDVQCVEQRHITSDDAITLGSIGDGVNNRFQLNLRNNFDVKPSDKHNIGVSNYFQAENTSGIPGENKFRITYTGGTTYILFNISTDIVPLEDIDAFKAWLSEHDLIAYYMIVPVETPIPPEEIAAYSALRTYSPTTVVTNDAGAWMKLGYKTKKSLEVTD